MQTRIAPLLFVTSVLFGLGVAGCSAEATTGDSGDEESTVEDALISSLSPAPGISVVRDGSAWAAAFVSLCTPGISVRATKFNERGRRVGDWAANTGVALAINADFFNYGSYAVMGPAMGGGESWPSSYQRKDPGRFYWHFGVGSAGMTADRDAFPFLTTDVVAGHSVIYLKDKGILPFASRDPNLTNKTRRTAIAIDMARKNLVLFASNRNLDARELASAVLYLSAARGLDLYTITLQDGGGSSQMYVRGQGALISSSRAVANHLGIYAGGSGKAWQCPDK